MASGRSSNFADWVALNLPGLLWFNDAVDCGYAVALATPSFAPDVLDFLAGADVQGGAIPKVSLFGNTEFNGQNGYMTQIALPDYIINKQREFALAEWAGTYGNLMGDGSRRAAILIENFLVGQTFNGQGQPTDVIDTLTAFRLSVKYRGYGALQGSNGDIDNQDTPVGPVALTDANECDDTGEAFPLMGVSVDFSKGDGGNTARVQHLVEVPNTVSIGDMLEVIASVQLKDVSSSQGIQWYGAKYKWIVTPYPLDPNTGAQLLTRDNEGQPRTDEANFEP